MNAQSIIPPNIDYGKISADKYSPDETYEAGELRIQYNSLWKAKQKIPIPEPWTPAHWDPTTLAAELSAVNSRMDDLETDKLQILRITDTDPSVSNQPHKVIQKHWNEISDGVYIAIVHCGSQNIAIIQRTSSGNYGSILYWRYGFSEPVMYSCSNGVWS